MLCDVNLLPSENLGASNSLMAARHRWCIFPRRIEVIATKEAVPSDLRANCALAFVKSPYAVEEQTRKLRQGKSPLDQGVDCPEQDAIGATP